MPQRAAATYYSLSDMSDGAEATPGRRARLLTTAVAMSFAVLAVAASTAHAHADFLGAAPSPGARVERSPNAVVLEFTESLNRRLSDARIVDARSGKRIAASLDYPSATKIRVRPAGKLAKAAYRVYWRSVATDDGHPLSGWFLFGVATPAGQRAFTETSPLAGIGSLVAVIRAAFYVLLLLFTGGVFCALLLSRRRDLADWLVPGEIEDVTDTQTAKSRIRRWLSDAGWAATALGAVVIGLEAFRAGGRVSPEVLHDYLFGNTAGAARLAILVLLVVATLAVRRFPLLAAGCAGGTLVAVALSGHAGSSQLRTLAVWTDAAHLIGGAVWLGGLGWIALAWGREVMRRGLPLRLAVMRHVLDRFGAVALPAFAVVLAAGFLNALVELGSIEALWRTSYGVVLLTKMVAVVLVAAVSYVHALRIRPRLLAANPQPPAALERRHWRLLRAEPALAVVVPIAAALLAAFPLPPRQATVAAAAARPAAAANCAPCPIPRPRSDELAVAEAAGPTIVAAWLRRTEQGLTGRLRLYGFNREAPRARARVRRALSQTACGAGCWDFKLARATALIDVAVTQKGRTSLARLPATWRLAGESRGRRLLAMAQNTMQRLRGIRDDQALSSGLGKTFFTRYLLRAPDRLDARFSSGTAQVFGGAWSWVRERPGQPWHKSRFGGGGPPFRTRGFFRWSAYANAVRLLGVRPDGGRRVAELALMDPAATPVWYRLWIDIGTHRVLKTRMIAGGHFMTDRYSRFDQRPPIGAPKGNVVAGG